MLRREAVRPELLGVLEKVASNSDFSNFYLVDGTALALMLGHRVSVDLDFFMRDETDFETLAQTLFRHFPEATVFNINKGGMNAMIGKVKVDFVRHDYPMLRPLENVEGITFLSMYDIALQKVHAIIKRGTKKDFIDLYYLFREFTLQEIVEGYQKKYGNFAASLIIRSLMWFEDAEENAQPEVFEDVSWEDVKDAI